MIYFTSDLHLFHNRPFLYEPRGFNNVYDMNQAIVRNWNNVVNPEDDIYVLGDLMLNDNTEGIKLIKQLKGNIHIILGNHDTTEREELYNQCYNVVEIAYATVLRYNGYHFYLSHYPTLTTHMDKRSPKKERINLFGHTHQQTNFFKINNEENCMMYHVGVDSHNCTPVSIDKIIEDIEIAYYGTKQSKPQVSNPSKQKYTPEQLRKKEQKKKDYTQALKYGSGFICVTDVIDACNISREYLGNLTYQQIMQFLTPLVYQYYNEHEPQKMVLLKKFAGKVVANRVSYYVRRNFS